MGSECAAQCVEVGGWVGRVRTLLCTAVTQTHVLVIDTLVDL